MTHTFPKIIWQTHNQPLNSLLNHLRQTSKTWVNLNPSWEHRYMDSLERDEVVKKYPKIYDRYMLLDPVAQSDIWRYLVTYEFGGVYADMDSVCIKPLDYMLDSLQDCEMVVVPTSHNGGKTNNANYAVKQQSHIMKEVINLIEPYVFVGPKKYKSPWDCFNDVVSKKENILYKFTSAIHSDVYKNLFYPNYKIDYYGTVMTYDAFLAQNNLEIL